MAVEGPTGDCSNRAGLWIRSCSEAVVVPGLVEGQEDEQGGESRGEGARRRLSINSVGMLFTVVKAQSWAGPDDLHLHAQFDQWGGYMNV